MFVQDGWCNLLMTFLSENDKRRLSSVNQNLYISYWFTTTPNSKSHDERVLLKNAKYLNWSNEDIALWMVKNIGIKSNADKIISNVGKYGECTMVLLVKHIISSCRISLHMNDASMYFDMLDHFPLRLVEDGIVDSKEAISGWMPCAVMQFFNRMKSMGVKFENQLLRSTLVKKSIQYERQPKYRGTYIEDDYLKWLVEDMGFGLDDFRFVEEEYENTMLMCEIGSYKRYGHVTEKTVRYNVCDEGYNEYMLLLGTYFDLSDPTFVPFICANRNLESKKKKR